MIAGLLQEYVATINSCGVKVITFSWEGVTASECRKAMTSATETFKKSLSALHLYFDDEDLSEAIKMPRKTIDASDLGENLLNRMDGVKDTCVRNNAAQSKEMWDRFLQVHYAEKIQPKLASVSDDESGGFADMQQFSREWLTFRDAYLKKDRGGANLECMFCGKNFTSKWR
ncbi:hypothetical protein PsorP6_014820 [Peronosclerospora sorghi]|uniref:Uncharacterized protein n=1 Tax=Peronosclerospora sorghi TaxID=230839 RepID=A0ACC0VUY7_9STRA|nr:hypothetical protein PsorP6_014820 [Peronosclerospora sorghi]